MLHHAIGIEAKTCLALRLGLEARPDVHAAWIEPGEERLLVAVRAVDKVERGIKKLRVHRLHALFVERTGVLTVLLAPRAETRVLPRGLDGGCRASKNPARAELEFELGVLGIVGVLRLVF